MFGCQSQPGAELGTILELFEVTDRGYDSGGGDGADAFEFGGALNLFIVFLVSSNALVAPLDMRLKLLPVFLGSLQHQTGYACDVVAGILQDIVEMLAKNGLELTRFRGHIWSLGFRPRLFRTLR